MLALPIAGFADRRLCRSPEKREKREFRLDAKFADRSRSASSIIDEREREKREKIEFKSDAQSVHVLNFIVARLFCETVRLH